MNSFKRMHSKYLPLLGSLFITTLIVSNIIAVKVGMFGTLALPVAVIVFPLAYILSDVVTEVYGYAAMRRLIWTGFMCNAVAVLLFAIALRIPPAPFFDGDSAFARILGATPRILGASFVAYLVGSFTNSFILAKLKVKTQGRFLWLRTITSTLIGEGIDSALFLTLAFAGIFPRADLLSLILAQWLFKSAFEVLATPFTYALVGFLKRSERIDHFDTGTNFNPIKF
ncbi:MAG: queuosine precursor transporter [Candidatus Peregrinibacteria bacterium]|nr:queuosine precursor transporter [Candidatus Peregrinibacteria bacterium]